MGSKHANHECRMRCSPILSSCNVTDVADPRNCRTQDHACCYAALHCSYVPHLAVCNAQVAEYKAAEAAKSAELATAQAHITTLQHNLQDLQSANASLKVR